MSQVASYLTDAVGKIKCDGFKKPFCMQYLRWGCLTFTLKNSSASCMRQWKEEESESEELDQVTALLISVT